MRFKFIFGIMFLGAISANAFIDAIKDTVDSVRNLQIYMEAASELADSVDDTSDISQSINTSSAKIEKVRSSLSELHYTQQDIQNFLNTEGIDSPDLPSKLQNIAQKIRKAKNIFARVQLLAGVKPEAITAGESLKSTAILHDIHYELAMFRAERQADRQSASVEKLEKLKQQNEMKRFFYSQFELMQPKGSSTASYSNIKFNAKAM